MSNLQLHQPPQPEGTAYPQPPSMADFDPEGPVWGAQPDPADLIFLVTPIGGDRASATSGVASPASPATPEQATTEDVLELLRREAESVLRDPNYVSNYATGTVPVARAARDLAAGSDPQPLQTLMREAAAADNHTSSLMEMLDSSASIPALFTHLEPVDEFQFFTIPPAPDVLRLFAGDIVPTQARRITASLSLREHHRISMNSACHPALAQTPTPDRDD